jgi:hypothetical protein
MTSPFRDSGRVNSCIIVSDLRDLEVKQKGANILTKVGLFRE